MGRAIGWVFPVSVTTALSSMGRVISGVLTCWAYPSAKIRRIRAQEHRKIVLDTSTPRLDRRTQTLSSIWNPIDQVPEGKDQQLWLTQNSALSVTYASS